MIRLIVYINKKRKKKNLELRIELKVQLKGVTNLFFQNTLFQCTKKTIQICHPLLAIALPSQSPLNAQHHQPSAATERSPLPTTVCRHL